MNVEIVVNSTLYSSGQITAGLNQYMRDITRQGYNPILTTANSTDSASDLRSHLAATYNSIGGLAGTVFVGDLPIAALAAQLTDGLDEQEDPEPPVVAVGHPPARGVHREGTAGPDATAFDEGPRLARPAEPEVLEAE